MELKIKLNMEYDKPNLNSMVYPKEVVEKAIEEYKKNTHMLGSLEYTGQTLDLNKAAFEIIRIENVDSNYVATINVLDTPEGRKLKDIIENGKQINDFRMCTMGFGSFKKENDLNIVNEDFKISYYSIFPKEMCA